MKDYSLQNTPAKISKELAQKHRSLRKNANLSQAKLALRSGVSLGSLKRFESTGKISMESFLKLLHVLGRLDELENILQPIENSKEIENLFSKKAR